MKKKKLHKIAPKLSEISLKKSGFEIPDTYFETVEKAVLSELNVDKIQSNTTKEIFTTPENYFNSIEAIVIARLKSEVIHKNIENSIPKNYFDSIEETVLTKISASSKIIQLKTRLTKFIVPIAIAASILLIFVLNDNSTTVSFDSLTLNEVENWIANGSIDYDALSIASMYPEIELKNEIFTISVSDNEVLNYLYEEDLDAIIYEN
tara:strand:+ start:8828 stop:9448 length:621 start_codon:yes stop_codon:yes gene_type:complete